MALLRSRFSCNKHEELQSYRLNLLLLVLAVPFCMISYCFLPQLYVRVLHNSEANGAQKQAWRVLDFDGTDTVKDKNSEKYAYVSLMAGCNPSDKKYLGYMFNAIVSHEILRESGSTADFVIMVRMAANASFSTLPRKDHASLRRAGLKVMYLSKPESEDEDNFLTAQMDKFNVLHLSKYYDKVIFMDGDVIPSCNLDVFFNASRSGLIEKNLVVSERNTPSNGGFFMLSLEEGDHEKAYDLISNRPLKFNGKKGWGHTIEHPDYWRTKLDNTRRQHWGFNAAPADQGFLYYWVKYVKKSVTISVNPDEGLYEDWSAPTNGDVVKVYDGTKDIPSCQNKVKLWTPWFHHFFQYMKPWTRSSDEELSKLKMVRNFDEVTNAKELWWYYLFKANKLHHLNLEIDEIKVIKRSTALPLGSWNQNSDRVNCGNCK